MTNDFLDERSKIIKSLEQEVKASDIAGLIDKHGPDPLLRCIVNEYNQFADLKETGYENRKMEQLRENFQEIIDDCKKRDIQYDKILELAFPEKQ